MTERTYDEPMTITIHTNENAGPTIIFVLEVIDHDNPIHTNENAGPTIIFVLEVIDHDNPIHTNENVGPSIIFFFVL